MNAVRVRERPANRCNKNHRYRDNRKEKPNASFGLGPFRCLLVYNSSVESLSHWDSWTNALRELLLSDRAPLATERKTAHWTLQTGRAFHLGEKRWMGPHVSGAK